MIDDPDVGGTVPHETDDAVSLDAGSTASDTASRLAGVRVLVVEDTKPIRHMMVRVLRTRQVVVEEADNGIDALVRLQMAAATGTPFDLVLTDLHMPELDGMGLIEKIRGIDAIRTTPVVVVSAENQKASIVEACQFGVSSYLLKPFTTRKLIDAVRNALAGSRPAPTDNTHRGLTFEEVSALRELMQKVARNELAQTCPDDPNPIYHPLYKTFQDFLRKRHAG